MRRALVIALAAALVGGCIDDQPLEQVVLDFRVLGAKFEVDGEPERAWPRVGESGTVTWQVAGPMGAVPVGWAFVICPATITPTGVRVCVGEPLDIQSQMTPSTDPPSFPVTFPEAALEDVSDVLVQGVLCPNGSPTIDFENADVSCAGSDEPRQIAAYAIHIERSGASNRNPSVPADALTFAGEVWGEPTATPPETGCEAMAGTAELPLARRSAAGEMGTDPRGDEAPQEVITITAADADRETYETNSGDEVRENLVFAHYATAGQPARVFSVIDDDETTMPALRWSYPPANDIAADGTLMRFFVTLIDERGGTDWTTRHLCILP